MKISVIIPTYNRDNHILNAITSIINQTYKVDEIIIIDDGSTDKTKDLIKNFINKNTSSKLIYFYQENKGVSQARNEGIKIASNDWLAFLDSDDTWLENKIQEHITFHKSNKDILCSYTDEIWIRNKKIINLKHYQQKEEPTFENSLKLCKIGASTFFCNKKIFDKIGYFDTKLLACEDYDLWLRILLKYKIKYLDLKLVNKYAGHAHQLSFETKLIDIYRIKALEKHINSIYKDEVLLELLFKTEILLKGARKHNNMEVINKFENKLKKYSHLI